MRCARCHACAARNATHALRAVPLMRRARCHACAAHGATHAPRAVPRMRRAQCHACAAHGATQARAIGVSNFGLHELHELVGMAVVMPQVR
eukprot:364225-Chlamydomonas_euryale.AAC.4